MADPVLSIINMAADAAAMAPTDAALSTCGQLAKQLQEKKAQLEQLEAQAKDLSAEIRQLEEHTIPEAMDGFNLSEFKTADGYEITISPVLHAAITKANEPAAFGWLRENGHEDLIKNKVEVALDRGQDSEAKAITEFLQGLHLTPTTKQSVHPQTLAAFCREQLAEGAVLPADLLGIHSGRVAKIALPKATKGKRK